VERSAARFEKLKGDARLKAPSPETPPTDGAATPADADALRAPDRAVIASVLDALSGKAPPPLEPPTPEPAPPAGEAGRTETTSQLLAAKRRRRDSG
jgi:hypothetical protein